MKNLENLLSSKYEGISNKRVGVIVRRLYNILGDYKFGELNRYKENIEDCVLNKNIYIDFTITFSVNSKEIVKDIDDFYVRVDGDYFNESELIYEDGDIILNGENTHYNILNNSIEELMFFLIGTI